MGRQKGFTALNAIDHSGETHDYWTIVRYSYTDKDRKRRYLVKCKCGVEAVMNIKRILNGESKSCGCRNIENHTTHNRSRNRIYGAWLNMKGRCTNPKSHKWPYYGGRGITVCDRWLTDFKAFAADMGEPPTVKHSIDRINNDGNYEPGNCRWATIAQQSSNRRKPIPKPNNEIK